MKRLLILLCFGILPLVAGAPPSNTLTIEFKPPYEPHEALWRAICITESSNDPNAVGDLNLRNKAYGISQIRKPRLDDYYKHTGIRYTVYDMFDTVKSKSVFMWYAMQNNPSEVEKTIRQWNGGPQGHKKQSTKKYYKKVIKYLDIK